MNELIESFMENEFGVEVREMPNHELFLKYMTMILHSHRYKKQEDFVDNINFEVIRTVLYKYSQNARKQFVKNPILAFLMLYFLHKSTKEAILGKVSDPSEIQLMIEEINLLVRECSTTLATEISQ